MAEVLIWIVRAVIYTLILRFVMRLFTPSRAARPRQPPGGPRSTSYDPTPGAGPRAAGPRPAAPAERVGGTLVRDPQCGTYIPESRALVTGAGDDRRYFCSAACRDAYAAARKAS